MWLASFRVAEVVASEHPLNPLRRELRAAPVDEIVLDPSRERRWPSTFQKKRLPSLASDEAFVSCPHEHTDGVPFYRR